LLALLVTTALCGCSTPGFSIRRLPDETPAADNAAAIKHATQLKATAAAAAEHEATAIASGAVTPLTPADAPSM